MFIRKAVTLFLELWSGAASVESAPAGAVPVGTECVVDWRWFME